MDSKWCTPESQTDNVPNYCHILDWCIFSTVDRLPWSQTRWGHAPLSSAPPVPWWVLWRSPHEADAQYPWQWRRPPLRPSSLVPCYRRTPMKTSSYYKMLGDCEWDFFLFSVLRFTQAAGHTRYPPPSPHPACAKEVTSELHGNKYFSHPNYSAAKRSGDYFQSVSLLKVSDLSAVSAPKRLCQRAMLRTQAALLFVCIFLRIR